MKFITALICINAASLVNAFVTPGSRLMQPSPRTSMPISTTRQHMMDPTQISSLIMAEGEKDFSDAIKPIVISLVFGGGLMPALISANTAMFKTLSGRKGQDKEEIIDPKSAEPGESFDPTLLETKYRKYVYDSGATGPELPLSGLLFAADRIPLVDIIAILGRIENVDTLADWKNLPSTKLSGMSATNPAMWLPRKAFKVNVRKAKFLGWPVDPKTGEPVGGEELKKAEMPRISKADAQIGDAALDAVFDTWAWGGGVATPDKVANSLRLFRPNKEVADIGELASAAVRGRSATGFAALTFIAIQILVLGSLFIAPALRFFFDIDIGLGSLGA